MTLSNKEWAMVHHCLHLSASMLEEHAEMLRKSPEFERLAGEFEREHIRVLKIASRIALTYGV